MFVRIQCIGLCRINIIIRGLSQDFAENPEAPANRNSPCSRVLHIDANGEVDGRGEAIACSNTRGASAEAAARNRAGKRTVFGILSQVIFRSKGFYY